jgi:hypothetical protein
MAFTHSKHGRLWIDYLELTSYFNGFDMAAKAGQADTTVYGLGASVFIGGLKGGTISAKAFWDASSETSEDYPLAQALGRNIDMALTFIPSGVTAVGTRCVVAFAAETDLSISAPVNNAVAVSMAAQASGGLSTGVVLFDPSTDIVTATTTDGAADNDRGYTPPASTTIASGSNTQVLPQATIDVASTTGPPAFAAAGIAVVTTSAGPQFVSYTGKTSTSLTGCTGGSGTMSTGGAVSQSDYSAGGLVANLHVVQLSGASTTITSAVLQHSDDNSHWATIATFPASITAIGAFTAFVGYGQPIARYLRVVLVTTGGSVSVNVLASAARQ